MAMPRQQTQVTDTAHSAIAEHETLALSNQDRQAFFEALIAPPEPNERLQRAMAEYKRKRRVHDDRCPR
jgi:uncharacterized protein (DUF1778 family)